MSFGAIGGAIIGGVTSAVVGSALSGSGGTTSGTTSSSTTSKREYLPFETAGNNTAAGITRGAWDYAKQFYQPIENELIDKTATINEGQVNERGGLAGNAVELAFQGNNREIGRQGLTLSNQQKNVLDRHRQLAIATGRSFAQNDDRLTQFERNKNVIASLTGFGRSSLKNAFDASSAAAGMESARNVQGGYTDTSTTETTQTSKTKSGGSI